MVCGLVDLHKPPEIYFGICQETLVYARTGIYQTIYWHLLSVFNEKSKEGEERSCHGGAEGREAT